MTRVPAGARASRGGLGGVLRAPSLPSEGTLPGVRVQLEVERDVERRR
jgi:hypothetical protein